MSREEKVVVLLVVMCFLMLSFTSPGTSLLMINHPPYAPTNFRPSPSDPFEPLDNVSIDSNFTWDGGDPDENDLVTYDIYFGTMAPPPKILSIGPYPWNQTHINWDPDFLLAYTTKYYGRIVARDNHNASNTSILFSFWTVTELPLLNVRTIRGGFMQVTAEIQNINNVTGEDAFNVVWNITTGIFYANGTIPQLNHNGGIKVVVLNRATERDHKWIVGFGPLNITVQAWIPGRPDVPPAKKSVNGFVFIVFVFVKDSDGSGLNRDAKSHYYSFKSWSDSWGQFPR